MKAEVSVYVEGIVTFDATREALESEDEVLLLEQVDQAILKDVESVQALHGPGATAQENWTIYYEYVRQTEGTPEIKFSYTLETSYVLWGESDKDEQHYQEKSASLKREADQIPTRTWDKYRKDMKQL